LNHFGCSANNEAVIGDLDERFRQGRSQVWYWRQVLVAILTSLWNEVAAHKLRTFFAAGRPSLAWDYSCYILHVATPESWSVAFAWEYVGRMFQADHWFILRWASMTRIASACSGCLIAVLDRNRGMLMAYFASRCVHSRLQFLVSSLLRSFMCRSTPRRFCVGKITGGGSIPVAVDIGTFGFTVQRATADGPIQGDLQYVNHATGARVHSVTFTSFSVADTAATFGGTCLNNDMPCTFTVQVTHNGLPVTDTSLRSRARPQRAARCGAAISRSTKRESSIIHSATLDHEGSLRLQGTRCRGGGR
jgi:hypothetical protein